MVIETSKKVFGAYVPCLPGCVAVGDTVEEVERLIAEAIDLHLEGMQEGGLVIPEPQARCEYIEAKVA